MSGRITMTTFYVATLSRSVLVEAATADEARERARTGLEALRPGAPVDIRTIRPATDEEIADARFHAEHLAANG
jgi:hypothetical protein